MTVENKNLGTKVGLLISYYITLSFWSAQTLCLSMVSRNIAGATKKSTVVAATFVSWAVGNSIGSPPSFLPPPPRPPKKSRHQTNTNLIQALKSSSTETPPATSSLSASTWAATSA